MLITEYDRDMDIAVNRREAWEDGHEDGLEEGMGKGREEGMEIGLEEGIGKGMIEGIEKEKLIIAKNMLEKGSSIDFIHDITGLSLEEIKKL
jgi:predicted transposase/invertase (TIGR01784 family)